MNSIYEAPFLQIIN